MTSTRFLLLQLILNNLISLAGAHELDFIQEYHLQQLTGTFPWYFLRGWNTTSTFYSPKTETLI